MEKRGRRPRVAGESGKYNLHIVLSLREAQILRDLTAAQRDGTNQADYVRRLIVGAAVAAGIIKADVNGNVMLVPAPNATCVGPPQCSSGARISAA